MTILTQKYSYINSFYAQTLNSFVLIKKSILLLQHSRSWTVLGIRIINRLCSRDAKVSYFLRFIFPKSAAWFDVKMAAESKTSDELLKAVQHLIQFRKIFYEYTLSEFNLDWILKTIEDKDLYSFKLLYQKRINEFLKGSALYEIHISFFMKKIPRINFYIDSAKFEFLLPVRYLYSSSQGVKKKLKDYIHNFILPGKLDNPCCKKHSVVIDGDTIWELENIKLLKGYQLIDDSNYICYEKAANPTHKFIAGYSDVKPAFRLLDEIPYVKASVKHYTFNNDLENVYLLSGRCSRNYFHWLIEYMPKILWMCRNTDLDFSQMSIAIDAKMPQQHYQALECILQTLNINNPVVKINPDKYIYNIKKMLVSSNPTFIPDSLEEYSYPECSGLNLETLREFRELFLKGISNSHDRKIYVARLGNSHRKLVNENEVIDLFYRYGFEVVYPEKYTFIEQMNLFNSAKYIVGPTGAAFSNLIFCQNNTTVINFLAEQNKEYAIFSNLCTLSNSKYYIETGELLKNEDLFSDKISWLYSDYYVNVDALEAKLQKLMKSV